MLEYILMWRQHFGREEDKSAGLLLTTKAVDFRKNQTVHLGHRYDTCAPARQYQKRSDVKETRRSDSCSKVQGMPKLVRYARAVPFFFPLQGHEEYQSKSGMKEEDCSSEHCSSAKGTPTKVRPEKGKWLLVRHKETFMSLKKQPDDTKKPSYLTCFDTCATQRNLPVLEKATRHMIAQGATPARLEA